MNAITVTHLTKHYGANRGIIDVDLHIAIIREWRIVGVATDFVKYQGKDIYD
ncbi:MAG: hypothetical protein IJW01_04475 [Paludibacteraceae bacterium]|nr:hypothetical protein [Paludibacteraceae bacterium]